MKENAYFDNAATTWPKPEAVYVFMDVFFRSHGVNPGRSGSLLAVEAEQMISQTRSMLGQFFNYSGPASRVVFKLNGTDALNKALGGLVGTGDHVVTTRLEHNAVLRTTNHLERDCALEVTRVEPNSTGYIDPDGIRRAINKRTRAIILNHASNVIGTVQPLSDVAQIAREYGIPLIVDAAQTAGVLPIDIDNSGIAILTFPGHKGLFGPMGVGGMIVSESVELAASRFGGTGVDSLSTYQPDAYPYRMEAGTVPLPGIAGLHAAQHWFKDLGKSLLESESNTDSDSPTHRQCCVRAMAHIHATELSHIERIEQRLKEYSSVKIIGEPTHDARVATMSFVVEGLSTERIADQLDADHHVCARAGLQCAPLVHVDAGTLEGGGTIRLSPGYFTDEEDMHQLLQALDDILG
jgi:cysteine desulfurase/selenocysteine lyase